MATSKSASETFSRLGMFGDRAMPSVDHILDPNARKISGDSDKTFGNCYNTAIFKEFNKAGIVFPFPQRDIYLHQIVEKQREGQREMADRRDSQSS